MKEENCIMISDTISEIEKSFENIEFSFSSYGCENNSLLKVSRTNEISDMIEDCLSTLSTLNSNAYIDQFKKKINIWIKKLTISKSVISTWLEVQSLWTLLKPIFSQDDITTLMPNEVKKFSQINKNWLLFMKNSSEMKNVISICYKDEGAEKFLIHLLDQIQECKNSLSFFLNLKREEFPRFYFITDQDLLEILNQRSNPQSIQRYLLYIFDSISYLNFDCLAYNKIIGFRSQSNEIVNLKNPFFANGNVEKWLNDFVDVVRETLRDSCSEIVQQMMTFDVEKWINLKFPSQILNLSLMLWLTYRIEDSLRKTKSKNKKIMKETLQEFETKFKELVKIKCKIDRLNLFEKIHVDVLITLFLNNLDIFRHLVQSNIISIDHADWQNQLRYYWNFDDKKCIVSIADVDREYSFEYFGLSSRSDYIYYKLQL